MLQAIADVSTKDAEQLAKLDKQVNCEVPGYLRKIFAVYYSSFAQVCFWSCCRDMEIWGASLLMFILLHCVAISSLECPRRGNSITSCFAEEQETSLEVTVCKGLQDVRAALVSWPSLLLTCDL